LSGAPVSQFHQIAAAKARRCATPDHHSGQGAAAVAFQAKLVFEGVEGALDPLAPATQRPYSAWLIGTIGTQQDRAVGGDQLLEVSKQPKAADLGASCAPRGIRTPNRQIRSQPSPVPARPPAPSASLLVLLNGHVAGPTRASVPGRHAPHGRNLVAVSAQGRQTGSLATGRSPLYAESRAPPHCGLSRVTAVSVPGIRQYSRTVTPTDQPEEVAILAAVRAGDQAAFVALAERYRRQLHVHCYRMLGSVEDAEDVVQETLLRAWRSRASFQGRSLFRTWLYRIATNACLNALQRAPRRILVADVPPRDPSAELPADERPDLAAPPAELPLAAALSGPPAGPGRPERCRARRRGRRPRDDRAGVPGRHPVPAAQAARHLDPARRARVVGQGHRRPA
jgi:RNA polymerase sigma factor (sigma-70 family)